MTAAITALLAILKSLPARAWLWIGGALFLVAIAAGAYWRGQHIGEVRIERVARAESTKAKFVLLDTAQTHLGTVLAHVAATKPATVTTGAARRTLRAAVTIVDSETVIVSGDTATVPVAVVALIVADDAKIKADAEHIAATDSLPPAIAATELAHATVDTALTHQIAAGDAVDSGGHGRVIVVTLAVLGTLGAVVALFHH